MTGSSPYQIRRYGAGPHQYGEYWPGRGGALVVLIHGGYWRGKYRLDLMHPMAADLQARGYAVWNVEYRPMDTDGGGWPGTFEDVASAVDAAADLDARMVDPERIGLIGHSAGGQLALWVAGIAERGAAMADGASAANARRPACRVVPRVVVSLAGVCDLAAAARLGLSRGAVLELLGGGPSDRPEVYAQADPMSAGPLTVSQLIVHGTADEDVPYELSERYAAREGAGEQAVLLTLPGTDHFELIDPASGVWDRVVREFAPLLPTSP